MTIRGPTGPRAPDARSPVDRQVQTLARALLDAGVAKTPAEAMKLARALLQATAGKAVPGATLPELVKLFQRDAGMRETGVVDRETMAALIDAGLLAPEDIDTPPAATDGPGGTAPTTKKPTDGVDRTPRPSRVVTGGTDRPPAPSSTTKQGEAGHRIAIDGAAARAEIAKPPALGDDMKSLTRTLGELGFAGKGQGAERLREQVREAQRALGLPITGKLDEKTRAAIEQYAAHPPPGARDARRGAAASRAPDGVERRGAMASEEHRDARVASRPDDGTPASASRAQDDGARLLERGGAVVDEGNRSGLEGDDGNAPAGDDDRDDERRGHATLDDGGAHERGHYEVPALSSQIAAALEDIVRDDDGRGPPSYGWDVTFYKPGIYGAGQPAEPLWHIGLARTSPFDDVWGEAARVLGTRLASLEPDARAPTREDFERALRRARYRDER